MGTSKTQRLNNRRPVESVDTVENREQNTTYRNATAFGQEAKIFACISCADV